MKISALRTISILTLAVAASATAARLNIESVQPPHWWTGMADNTLQLQIYGKDIKIIYGKKLIIPALLLTA